MSEYIRIGFFQTLILKFRIWSEWGHQSRNVDKDYFSFYDIVCCMLALTPVSIAIAITAHSIRLICLRVIP